MQIAIIGAGNVATHLTLALHQAGIQINAVVSRKIKNAKVLANQVNAQAFSNMKKYHQWSQNDFVIVAVKDDAIMEVMRSGLLQSCNVLHTSGSFESSGMKAFSATFGAFYPFQTFRKTASVDLSEVPFFVETSDPLLLPKVKELAASIAQNVFEMSSPERRKLHVSGVFINNFIYFILDKMKHYCVKYSIDTNVLMPLLQQTIQNALYQNENLQTGPAVRGDKETINQHLQILQDDQSLQDLYKILSSIIFEESNGKEIKL